MIRKRKGVTTHACEHTGSPYKKQLSEKNENTNKIQSIPKKKKLLHTKSYYDERLKRNVKIDNESRENGFNRQELVAGMTSHPLVYCSP